MWELRQLSSARLAGERARAARRLRDRRSPLAIGGLIDALEDPSRTVRQAAADALGKIGTSEASAPLARALVSPESGVRHAAARALGRIGDFASLQALLQNLRNLDSETLGQSVDALARIGDSAAILPLISLFDEIEDPGLRQKISEALCAINKAGTPQEIMALFGRDRRPHVAGVRV
jgi:HEAT repeat protein